MTKTVLIPNKEDFSKITAGADELRVQVSNLNPRSSIVTGECCYCAKIRPLNKNGLCFECAIEPEGGESCKPLSL